MDAMDAKEERGLAQKIEQGDGDARTKMVEGHIWLAGYLARRYYGLGLSFDDLKQEDVIALFKALESFDYRKGRFSTHASFWIRQQMTRAIFAASSLISLPIPVHEEIRTGKRDLNSVPTVDFESSWRARFVDKKARPNGEAINNVAREQLRRVLQDCLSEKEFQDFWHYFEGWTVPEIAKARRVSRQAVYGNIQEALRKLRHPARAKMLKELLQDS